MAIDRHARAVAHHAAGLVPGLWNLRTSSVLPQRLRGGVHDPELRALRLDELRSPLIFDVGANIGQTVTSVKRLAPQARVIAFEPVPFALRSLLRIAARLEDVTVIPAACGARSGELHTVYVPTARGVVFSQQATLCAPHPEALVRFLNEAGFSWVNAANLTVREQPVVTVALDDLGVMPDIIKVDAEGGETAVLQGARRCLTEGSPILFIETVIDGSAVGELVRAYGYRQRGAAGFNTIYAKA
jgi:FkbM family methyltransferase